jgi:hypothetical protein
VMKSVWKRRKLLSFGGIYLSLVCFSVVNLFSYCYVLVSVLFSNKLDHLKFVLV